MTLGSSKLKNGIGSCEQHLLERDSMPHNVQQFRTFLDRIANEHGPCYLDSPIMSHIKNIGDYETMMINVVVNHEGSKLKHPIKMTCKVGVSVSHVIKMALEQLPELQSELNELILRVCGRDEYLDNYMLLSDYEYVHQCLKFGTDVHVTMVMLTDANQTFTYKSTIKEDYFDCFKNHSVSISKDQLNDFLCLFFDKVHQYRMCIQSKSNKMMDVVKPQLQDHLIQFKKVADDLKCSVQSLYQLLSTIEPLLISEIMHNLKQTTLLLFDATYDDLPDTVDAELEEYITIEGNLTDSPNSPVINAEALQQEALSMLDAMTNAVKEFVADYCVSFNMPFIPTWPGSHDQFKDHVSTLNISTLEEPLRIKICCLHRPGNLLSCHMYQIEAGLYYGECQVGKTQISHCSRVKKRMFNSIIWDTWLNFLLPLSQLPLETTVCFTIYENEPVTKRPIGWVAMPIFNMNRHLQTGEHYLCVWPSTKEDNPVGACEGNMSDPKAMILQVSFDCFGSTILYNDITSMKSASCIPTTEVEQAIKVIAQKDHFMTLTEEEQHLLWNNRYILSHILSNHPRGLPLLLLSLPDYSHSNLADVHAILDQWKLQEPTDALELLNVQFTDIVVRDKALLWLHGLSSDDLYDLLPQLVQVVKYDWPGYYGTIQFLLQQAALSPHLAHMLLWLTHPLLEDPYFGLQYKMLWVGLKIVCSGTIGEALDQQLSVVESLQDIAMAVKTAKVDRQTTLVEQLQKHSIHLNHAHYRLPLSLSMLVSGLEVEKCSFFNSNTVPLKLTFINYDPNGTDIPIIFKIGDDLRQDMVTLQLIKLMEKIWLRAGLDLKMLTYRCLPTGPNQGILEMVTEAETLRSIQTSRGLIGGLNEKRLAEWLMKHNNSDTAYKKAIDCFTRSCAGYCVATYVLGICDRHNDNIMVKKSGHMFHIDFGRIFGNAQMFGTIRRDRAPFVLTPDMVYVINRGDTPTPNFQQFTDLCCAAYNELRKNYSLFINLLELMFTSGIPELSSSEDIQYVHNALLPGETDAEAAVAFRRCIQASLGSKATRFNFLIHNIAQMTLSDSFKSPSDEVLSFCQTSYSYNEEERILEVVISKCLKRYSPQKYYVYEIEVTRPKGKEQVFRRYREFNEMHTKLVSQFPDHSLPALPSKIYVGRSQLRLVAEKRRIELNEYLQSLLKMDSTVSKSDILYTFLHQMIRDETDASKMEEFPEINSNTTWYLVPERNSNTSTSLLPSVSPAKVQLQISYSSLNQLLSVMVGHVSNLVPIPGTNTANPYVKVYLLPDPYKSTKKKTEIKYKTLHPTYYETLTYKVPQGELPSRILSLSVWDYGSLYRNKCLGAVSINIPTHDQLTTGEEIWYNLQIPS